MGFGVERARGRRCPKRRDRFGVPALPRERHSEVERCIGVLAPRVEHESKGALSLRKLLFVKRLPSMRERGVGG